MTQTQIDLLKRLIDADRQYHSKRAAGLSASRDERGVEIGWINGVNPRTALSLEEAGLAESLDPGINGHPFLFLGQYEPYDEVT